MNSRQKGARGEREAAALLRSLGFEARRGQQYNGVEGQDVVHSIPGVHIEVKRTETLSVYAAVAQAVTDAAGNLPVVLHKRNRKDWLFIVRAEDVLRFARVITEAGAARVSDASTNGTTRARTAPRP